MNQHWKHAEDYDRVHRERYRLSRQWLAPHLRPGLRVLECGDPGTFSRTLAEQDGIELANIRTDLRYQWAFRSPYPFDLVLCMEVLEHLHDKEAEKPTEWRGTGAAEMLRSIRNALADDGLLFLTTPNACSYNVLGKVLTMQPPMVYRPHVREYAPAEVAAMLREAGFRIERLETLDPWGGGVNAATHALIQKLTRDHAHHSPHRGECIFVIARKPAAT